MPPPIILPLITGTVHEGVTIVSCCTKNTEKGFINITTVTSSPYKISAGGTTITNVPSGTSKADLLAALAKAESHQTWDDIAISNPVVTG